MEELSVEPAHRQREMVAVAAERDHPIDVAGSNILPKVGEHVVGDPDHQWSRKLVGHEVGVPQRPDIRGVVDAQSRRDPVGGPGAPFVDEVRGHASSTAQKAIPARKLSTGCSGRGCLGGVPAHRVSGPSGGRLGWRGLSGLLLPRRCLLPRR